MLENSVEQDRLNLKPKKFLMWLFVITSFMLFAALTSGFIVYTAGDPSRGIKMILPKLFMYSTCAIILSSVTMHLAYKSAKALKFTAQKMYLALTILLGVLFFVLQIQAWKGFVADGVFFINPNASQSFIYVITGTHLLHIFAGIIVLITALGGIMKNIPQVRNLFRMEMASIFWHFLDILWIYLYVFLLLNQ
ncbi:cytochrome c oxidase subunit 3 [Desertivirga xinjiangensis]|uniref:cytochrome c oxidase subunit 3 n=1 Tax=Desertivirga xinjiangensis TaxID=539206 RepID=UPI00210D8958|nr:cytochrome c oxidase subunit 3 [Pedobacter xinjiangensis]